MKSFIKLQVALLVLACGPAFAEDLFKQAQDLNLAHTLYMTNGGYADSPAALKHRSDFVIPMYSKTKTGDWLVVNNGGALVAAGYSSEVRTQIRDKMKELDRTVLRIAFKADGVNKTLQLEFREVAGNEIAFHSLNPFYVRVPDRTVGPHLEIAVKDLTDEQRAQLNAWVEQRVIDYPSRIRKVSYSIPAPNRNRAPALARQYDAASVDLTSMRGTGNSNLENEAVFQLRVITELKKQAFMQ